MTRAFPRPVDLHAIDSLQLGALLDAELDLTGIEAPADATSIYVTHEAITGPSDDAAIQAVIDAYVFDPEYGHAHGKAAVPTLEALLARIAALEVGQAGTVGDAK